MSTTAVSLKTQIGCQGLGGGRGWEGKLMGTEFLFEVIKMFWNRQRGLLSNSVNILKTTELLTLKGRSFLFFCFFVFMSEFYLTFIKKIQLTLHFQPSLSLLSTTTVKLIYCVSGTRHLDHSSLCTPDPCYSWGSSLYFSPLPLLLYHSSKSISGPTFSITLSIPSGLVCQSTLL